ncbi:MAG: DUF4347 domain-containing protein, partial [Pseudomonadota bacterium]|nr:DUF4347 domain-containing protein [Pseudomonadota bacterium]
MSIIVKSACNTVFSAALLTASITAACFASAAPAAAEAHDKVLTVIDTSIADWQVLEEAAAGTQILLLKPDADPLTQINARLRALGQVDGLHIVSHGSTGALHFPGHSYSLATLQGDRQQWQELGGYVVAGGDILLYGCEVADGAGGREFVEELSRATQRDVAASVDVTGTEQLQGNWNLELQTGQLAIQPLSVPFYSGLLQPYTLTFASGGDLNYTNTSVTRTVGGRTFTLSGVTELAYEAPGGIYANESGSAVCLRLETVYVEGVVVLDLYREFDGASRF